MIWGRGPSWGDESTLANAWRDGDPFPYLELDTLVHPDDLPELLAILDDEPVETRAADLYLFDASDPEPRTAALRKLRDDFFETYRWPLMRITGKGPFTRVDMRAYAYRPGHYLLPHADHQAAVGRAIAFAYYVPSPEPPEGGELEMYRCASADGALVSTESARLILPVPNRIVFFDVSDVSLHQVREVTKGLRVSLSGWFYT